jgi:hypothetical protein
MGKLELACSDYLKGRRTCFPHVVPGEEHERCHASKAKSRKFRVEQFQELAAPLPQSLTHGYDENLANFCTNR